MLLDEMLTGLGALRDSWTGTRNVWAEHWVSKNGVYDLYPIAAPDGWKMSTVQTGDSWTKPGYDDSAWKTSKLESFASLGLPESGSAQFRKTIAIPDGWRGRRIWINGTPAAIHQPMATYGESSFTLDVTDQAATGSITLAVSTDGLQTAVKTPGSPSGVTGVFMLQAMDAPVSTELLPGPWLAGTDVNVLSPLPASGKANCVYMETRFTLPRTWPSKRMWLVSPDHLGFLMLNDTMVSTPKWMKSLDISGLVKRDGSPNVLRWLPRHYDSLDYRRVSNQSAPSMSLAWLP